MPVVPHVHRIAVLRANALGDYLTCVPALESLRAAYPGAEIVLLGAPWHARVLAGRPGPVDRVLVAPALPGIRAEEADDPAPAAGAAAFFDKARAEDFDLALQLHGGGRHSNPVVKRLGARVTAGLRAADAPPLDRTVPYLTFQPEVFRYLEAVDLVGAPPVTYRPRWEITGPDRAEAGYHLDGAADPVVALHPGANDGRRRWPAERFAAVGDALAAAGAHVIVTGTRPEGDLVRRVCALMTAPAAPLAGQLSVPGLAALYARCAVVVSNDTGPLHLAAAVGTPVVGLFWAANMINWAGVDRAAYRPVISWTMTCPECGAPRDADLYPARSGRPGCDHRVSFLVDIPVAEVTGVALDLLGARS
jgi:ADP-heptose:LPS heptosyltransferase